MADDKVKPKGAKDAVDGAKENLETKLASISPDFDKKGGEFIDYVQRIGTSQFTELSTYFNGNMGKVGLLKGDREQIKREVRQCQARAFISALPVDKSYADALVANPDASLDGEDVAMLALREYFHGRFGTLDEFNKQIDKLKQLTYEGVLAQLNELTQEKTTQKKAESLSDWFTTLDAGTKKALDKELVVLLKAADIEPKPGEMELPSFRKQYFVNGLVSLAQKDLVRYLPRYN